MHLIIVNDQHKPTNIGIVLISPDIKVSNTDVEVSSTVMNVSRTITCDKLSIMILHEYLHNNVSYEG